MSPMTPIMRTIAQRRAMSIGSRARAAFRSFEPHPFQRPALTQETAAPDWGRQVKRISAQAGVYVSFYAIILGWPLVAKEICDGHI